MHLKGAAGTQTLPAAVSLRGCCGTMETVPCFVLAQHFGPRLSVAGRAQRGSPTASCGRAGSGCPGSGSSLCSCRLGGPWRGKPCRVALLLLKDCCFFSRLTDKAKTDTQFKHGPPKAFHFGPSKAKCLLRNVLA